MSHQDRRNFIKKSALATAAISLAPAIHTSSRAYGETIVGTGEFTYRANHTFAQLPDKYKWQTTHNVAVDAAQNLYVIHEGREELKDHPSIFVFDSSGKFIRAFGEQFQGGGHGLEVRKEGNEEFLYVSAYQQVKSFCKMTLSGETLWQNYAPMEAGVYADGEATAPKREWGQNRFMPTNFAFLDDGGFLLADGYGSYFIHRYDKDGKWISKFGGPGDGAGTFKTPHGLWIDRRNAHLPVVVVTDRAHNTLQRFTIDGEYIDTLEGFGLPANIDVQGDLMLVPELVARVSILDKDNKVIATFGADVERLSAEVGEKQIRKDPSQWHDGKFVHPHDACFDAAGNIFVAEWVDTGRVTKLERVS
jgi:hypothetical protein